MIKRDKLAYEVINILDKDGFTPFLAFLKKFIEIYDTMFSQEREWVR